jgi:hypothetical protein
MVKVGEGLKYTYNLFWLSSFSYLLVVGTYVKPMCTTWLISSVLTKAVVQVVKLDCIYLWCSTYLNSRQTKNQNLGYVPPRRKTER